MKLYIPLLLGSSRIGRQSLHVANFIFGELGKHDGVRSELIDLAELRLPIMEQRMDHSHELPPGLLPLCDRLRTADGLLIVTPEYKNGYPGVLKNALDYLPPQVLRRTPIGIATVSAGGFGGINCLAQLRLVCLALGGVPIPESFPISKVQNVFDESGTPHDVKLTAKLEPFLRELIWYSDALARHREPRPLVP